MNRLTESVFSINTDELQKFCALVPVLPPA
jgi:hypothetical protein